MTKDDRAALRALATQATPGPWEVVMGERYPRQIRAPHVSPHKPGAIRDITRWNGISMPASAEGQANAAHMAAADPSTLLRLLDALDEAEVTIYRLKVMLSAAGKDFAP